MSNQYKRGAPFKTLERGRIETLDEAVATLEMLIEHVNTIAAKMNAELTNLERTASKSENVVVATAQASEATSSATTSAAKRALEAGSVVVTAAGTITITFPMVENTAYIPQAFLMGTDGFIQPASPRIPPYATDTRTATSLQIDVYGAGTLFWAIFQPSAAI